MDEDEEKPKRSLRVLMGGGGNGDESGGGDPSKPKLRKLRAALVFMGLAVLALISWVFGIMTAVAGDLPALENRAQFERAENSVIFDRNGERLATLTNNEGRVLVASDEIAPVMKEAVVAIEDQRFYEHRGVDVRGIGRALVQDVIAGSAEQGASTITQQFVKNALAAQDDRTVFQKLREAALAYQLERNWTKDKIITEYLNSIYFGEGAYGIEAAAKTFFGSSHPGCGDEGQLTCAAELLPYEAATLAGIVASPSAYSPRDQPEAATSRRNQVLINMEEQGYITNEELTDYASPSRLLPAPSAIEPPADDSEAPYFTSWLRQQLVDRYGAGEAFGGGLVVHSTLDLEYQALVDDAVSARVDGVGLDSSVVVLDNETAGVLAMVGGDDYAKEPFNLATNGLRQPGSSFKPFTLVAALEEDISTSEVFNSAQVDIPFEVKIPKEDGKDKILPDLFEVNNYADTYRGPISLASGTTFSDNSVYSQVGTRVGLADIANTAEALGVRTDLGDAEGLEYSLDGSDFHPYPPSMILGSQVVTPLEMAHSYNTIEEDGDLISGSMAASKGGPVAIEKVLDSTDEDAEPVPDKTGATGVNESIRDQVISPETAETASTTLATVVTSGTGKRAQTGEPTWGKTGTTDDNGDAWFCGATPDITTCVWVGNADSREPMLTEFGGQPVDGGTIPALIFADVVNAYLSVNEEEAETTVPAPIVEEAPVVPEEVPTEPAVPVEPEVVPEEPVEPEPEPEPVPEEAAGIVPERRR
ncbi:MAG: transglycosylase domain-containing protein [Actinomycetota bacterium]|nr:transglycosylase domain-containing protein [Actinomycetota bacterium]